MAEERGTAQLAAQFGTAITAHFSPRYRSEEALVRPTTAKEFYTGAATVKCTPGEFVVMRAGPSPLAPPVGVVPAGTTLAVIETTSSPRTGICVHTHRGWSDATPREGQLLLTGNTGPLDAWSSRAPPQTPRVWNARETGRCSPDFRRHFKSVHYRSFSRSEP
jgi:hypothetical protein